MPVSTPVEAMPRHNLGRRFTRRIGNTNYEVVVYLSETSRETMNDKILRIIKNESIGEKAAGQ